MSLSGEQQAELDPWLSEQLLEYINTLFVSLAISAENAQRFVDLRDVAGLRYTVRCIRAYVNSIIEATEKLSEGCSYG
jgi:hypothetical protein